MTFDFETHNDQTISLSVFKTDNDCYKLVDQDQKMWLEVELKDHDLRVNFKDKELSDSSDSLESKLQEVLFYILETENSGTDSFSEIPPPEIKPYDPDKIKVRSDKIAVSILSKMIDSGSLDLSPDFQRNLVWTNNQKSRLIESILLRIPLPMFYFSEDEEGNLSVVDGLQRISAIKEFMDNKFPLKGLQYLQDTCGGRYYESKVKKQGLEPKYLKWFDLTSISANIIDPSSPSKVKYDIFRRINTGGKPLNNQEIRNCLMSKELRDVLKTMAGLPEFKSATNNSIKSIRLEDQEVALRFLNFYELYQETGGIDGYNGNMENTLDEYTEKHSKKKIDYFEKSISKFSNAMKNAEYLIGKKYAFRKIQLKDILPKSYKQLINKALFVCSSILLAEYDHEEIRNKNKKGCMTELIATKIDSDSTLLNYLSYGTNGRANLLCTFKALDDIFSKNIKR